MSPQESRRLVGQPDIVELVALLRETSKELGEAVTENEDIRHDIERHVGICAVLLAENARLATALRAVRASTDPKWQAQIISDALRETP